MVDIIPKVDSFGTKFARGLGGGLGQGFSKGIQGKIDERSKMKILQEQARLEQQGKQAEIARRLQAVEEFKQTEGYEKLTPIQKFVFDQEVSGLISGGTAKSIANAEREQVGFNQLKELTSTRESPSPVEDLDIVETTENEPNDGSSTKQKIPQSKLEKMSDAALVALQGNPNKNTAALGKAEADRRKQLREFDFKQKLADQKAVDSSYGENKTFIDKTLDQYEDSLRKEAILGRMSDLEEEGELSGSGIINLLEGIGFKQEWLKNPANEEYTKLALDLLGGGSLQADYGSRVLASEFKVSQQRIPSLSQTPEGRKQIKENLKTMLLPAKLKNERIQ